MSRSRRWVLPVLFAVGAVAGAGYAALAGGSDSQAPVVPAEPGEPAYSVSDVQLATLPDRLAHQGDIGLTFTSSWTTDSYPGTSRCLGIVKNAAGETIGTRSFSLMTALPDRPIGPLPVSLQKAEAPASATVTCARADLPPSDAGYLISSALLDPEPNRNGDVILRFDVAWKTEDPPLEQQCSAVVDTTGGELIYPFMLSVGEGPTHLILPPDYLGGAVKEVSCGPYRGG